MSILKCLTCAVVWAFNASYSVASDGGSTINGKPIPEQVFSLNTGAAADIFVLHHHREPAGAADQQEIEAKAHDFMCTRLQGAIETAAKDAVKKKLGIVVTTQDLLAAQKSYPILNPGNLHDRAVALLTALADFYDRKIDAEKVYESDLKPLMPRTVWTIYLHDTNTPAARERFEKTLKGELGLTREVVLGSGSLEPWRRTAEITKLNDAVDQEIAITDPQFRLFLAEPQLGSRSKEDRVPVKGVINMDHVHYLAKKRADFWKNQVSKLSVSLSDPSSETSCQLANVGVQVAGH